MKRKIFTLCTALILGASTLLANYTAVDGIYYDFNATNLTASVTYCGNAYDSYTNEYTGDVVIPATVTYGGKTYSVTSIGEDAFRDCGGLTSVTIGNSVTSIGDDAFRGCSGLTKTNYTGNIAGWCGITFKNEYSNPMAYSHNLYINDLEVKELVIPNSVTSIGNYAFSGCSGLTSITIPNSVTSIGSYAFADCSGLTSVTIPNSVTSIGDSVFYDCSGLTSVTWNAQNCEDLKKIESYPYYNNTPFFNIRSQITSFTFGDAVEHIPACLCSDMDNLTSITIPNSVTSIGDDAFRDCGGLTSVTIGNSVESIGSSAFVSCDGLTEIILPNSLKSLGDWAFGGCTALKSLVIPPSVEVLYMGIVANCNNLTKIIVQNPNIQVYDYGYSREAILSWISHDINTLSYYYISGLPKLDTIVAPAACFDVPEVGLPICTNTLKYAKVTNGNLTSDGFAFLRRSVKYLKTLDMRATTNTEIPDQAMSGCYGLDSVLLPSSVEYIGYMAFSECIRLREITIPWTVRKIEARAFENCRNIRLATFLLSVLHAPQRSTSSTQGRSELQEIGDWAFYNCHLLQNVELPEGVEIVGNGAFYGCTYLEELSLPSSVQSIGDNCFALASKLEKITVNAVTPPTIEAKTFYNVDRTIPVVVPSGALESYTAADYWSEFINIEEAPVTAIAATPTIAGLYTESGRIVCEGEFRIYDLLGHDVTRLNGSLCGVYVVKSGNATQKVVVK